mmetsp:Transcript_19216/g.40448  ORF Transcript_19216/g.40448 Transcript_19216/m.40448 type:complete len:247 (-) Transcript_19216:521-1261(-)|eukprot:CAMPEP_0168181010 /NCGR_PEP_ID=MMETSP0139_2-20121125/10932_1 /TAXON_ID=44445 /ORGANISM="Pseudo-nitzschia australis, Strain 10249 10 AB" /LENGTH=246 /DNA_ID=CAMNT_0008101445 /DNA_START=48 /DNA_END=788 /DNA_ORIENTATION=-
MSIASTTNIKFLFALLAWIAVATTTDAATVRGNRNERDGERQLKKSKNISGGISQPIQPTQPTTVVADTNAIILTGTNTGIENQITAFEVGCGDQAQNLNNCVQSGGRNLLVCKQCIVGLSTLIGPTIQGLKTCSSPVHGDYCAGCVEQVSDYYTCGTGVNLGVTVTAVVSSGSTGGNITTTTATGAIVNGVSFAPIESCPFNTAEAGDSCGVPTPFDVLECFFPGLRCTCRSDEKKWACFIHPQN